MQAGYVYSRWQNPTTALAAEAIAELEGAEGGALMFGSGMNAISTALMAFLKKGDHIVSIGFWLAFLFGKLK